MNQQVIDVVPVMEETLSPQEFIELVHKDPGLIARTAIALPQLGKAGFGRIRVEYSRPRYKSLPAFKPVAR
ncbi:hypothetical protein [Delftia tsuruhatensis]|uniref:hypothetical protein n=1 Tax=Delftia tsuruhatensis TaxID=180282 RepID=UPI0012A9C4B4|nr:hypothetical protein [Delftia tsuruhatensis]QFS66550.1 hypothetical protein GCS91_20645 [Delftia tsuruhatensis]